MDRVIQKSPQILMRFNDYILLNNIVIASVTSKRIKLFELGPILLYIDRYTILLDMDIYHVIFDHIFTLLTYNLL